MSTTASKVPGTPNSSKRKSAAPESSAPESPAKTKTSKGAKAKKHGAKIQELVRDRFTFPAEDYARLGSLKQRILLAGRKVKKSEILRAGLISLSTLDDAELLRPVEGIESSRADEQTN